MIRPEPARWFEILAAEDDAPRALESLAATGAIELEAKPTAKLPPELAELRPMLQRYGEFAQRYRAYWPKPCVAPLTVSERPSATLARCLERMTAWSADAEGIIVHVQKNQRERAELELWQRVLAALASSNLDLGDLARAGPLIDARLFVFPPELEPALPRALPLRRFVIDKAVHAVAIGTAEELQPVVLQTAALKGRTYAIPSWLHSDHERDRAYLASRLGVLEREDAELEASLETLHARHELALALGEASRLQWVIDNVHALETSDVFCWITGWTSELAGNALAAALERCGARAILHYPPAPAGAKPPLVLANPAWARPFEVFSRALGMPARNEADPTALLAVVVPLMFGYMFGDFGQGLVIAALGFALRKRWPLARLFVTGGLSAACFGLLFGSVFSLDLMHPLWVEPLTDPLTVLLVPLYGGAALLTLGLLLTALEARWRCDLTGWLCSDVWLVVVYVSLLAGLLWPEAFRITAAAAILFCAGRAWSVRRWAAAPSAVAELVERTLQIVINTLSFARIGAFALAHAGLSSAIVALMHATASRPAGVLVLVLGNVIVLVLEGLVVSIQTTRLVLFEFFTRFLVAQGRVFRPLPLPPSVVQEH